MELVEDVLPEPSPAELAAARSRTPRRILWQTGPHRRARLRRRALFRGSADSGPGATQLRLRVVKSIPLEQLPHAADLGPAHRFWQRFSAHWLGQIVCRWRPWPAHRRHASSPTKAKPTNTGMSLLDAEQIFEYGQTGRHAAASAWPSTPLATAPTTKCSTAYAQLRAYEAPATLCPHCATASSMCRCFTPTIWTGLAELEVIASVQPIHATSDMFMADRHWGNRSAGAYAFAACSQRGTRLAFGSDAPVESPNPFLGLHAAVTRAAP